MYHQGTRHSRDHLQIRGIRTRQSGKQWRTTMFKCSKVLSFLFMSALHSMSFNPANRILARTTCLLQIKDKFVGDASSVDAENCSGGGDVAQMETQLEEKLPSSLGVVDCKYAVPHLNEAAPEPASSGDDDKGSTFSSVSSLMADLEVVVKIIRELEIRGHLKQQFRLKFLTWYSLRATEKEGEAVCAYIRTIHKDLSSLAAQLMDTFSYIMHRRP